MKVFFLLCWIGAAFAQCSDKSRIRLVGGSRNGEGRLEVQGSSGWSSVCPDKWATRNAGVACQELCSDNERKYATSIPALGRFGPITNPIRIFDTNCQGYETSLSSCSQVEHNSRSCFEDTAVGLCCHSGCTGQNLFLAPRLRYSASCGWGNFTVTVQYPGAGLDGIMRPFYLEPYSKPNCWDQQTGANSTHNWITVPYNGDCGVSDNSNSSHQIFQNTVLIKGQSTGPSISRYYRFLLPITCGVDRGTNKTLWLDTSPPEGIIENLPPENGTLKLDMVIKVFEDGDYTKERVTPVKLPVGTPVFVQLSVNKEKLNAGGRSKIVVEDCFAFPYDNADIKHIIIKKQLAVDDATDILKSPWLSEVRFKMETFKIPNHKELHISCTAYVCPESDNTDRCKGLPAMAQHTAGASRFARTVIDPRAQVSGSAYAVVSPSYEVPDLALKRQPIYYEEDLPGLGPEDEVRLGVEDGRCYLKRSNGLISLYHKPKQTSIGAKNINQCLSQ